MYERTASECKKLPLLIHYVFGINLTVLSQIEYDNARKRYVIIVKELVLLKYPAETGDKVWNVFLNKTVLHIGVKKKPHKNKMLMIDEELKKNKRVSKEGKNIFQRR